MLGFIGLARDRTVQVTVGLVPIESIHDDIRSVWVEAMWIVVGSVPVYSVQDGVGSVWVKLCKSLLGPFMSKMRGTFPGLFKSKQCESLSCLFGLKVCG